DQLAYFPRRFNGRVSIVLRHFFPCGFNWQGAALDGLAKFFKMSLDAHHLVMYLLERGMENGPERRFLPAGRSEFLQYVRARKPCRRADGWANGTNAWCAAECGHSGQGGTSSVKHRRDVGSAGSPGEPTSPAAAAYLWRVRQRPGLVHPDRLAGWRFTISTG